MCMIYRIRRIIGESNIWRIDQKSLFGITLIWQKAVAISKHISCMPEMASFKFGGLKIIHQAAKLNTLPIILRIWYKYVCSYVHSNWFFALKMCNCHFWFFGDCTPALWSAYISLSGSSSDISAIQADHLESS